MRNKNNDILVFEFEVKKKKKWELTNRPNKNVIVAATVWLCAPSLVASKIKGILTNLQTLM